MSGGYAAVPASLLVDERLSSSDVRTLLALSSWLGCEEIRPSHAAIAERAGRISVRTVRRSLDRLRNLGLIEWAQRHREDGGQTSHSYRIITPWIGDPLDNMTTPPGQDDQPPLVKMANEVSKKEVTKKNKNSSSAAADGAFEDFYRTYPRKVGRGQAVKAWRAAVKKAPAEAIIAAAQSYADQARGKDAQFIAHPSSWLNGERWSDEESVSSNGQQHSQWGWEE